MKRNWVKGWNNGLTGPNTPALPTVSMSVAARYWERNWTPGSRLECPNASDYFIPIACGDDTVAIAVGTDRDEIATLIAKAPRMETALQKILEYAHPKIDRKIIDIVKEALGE